MSNTIRQRRFGHLLLAAALTLTGTAVAGTAVASTARAGTPAEVSPRAPFAPASLLPGSVKLNGVYCTTSRDCWAVGIAESSKSAILNQIVHWNGAKWTGVSVPDPGGTKMHNESELFGVRCTSAINCWAVGSYSNATKADSQVLHWNGKQWALVHVPSPGGNANGTSSGLFDVACTSASSCWAVGQDRAFSISSDVTGNFALHWNGKKWSKIPTPNPAGSMSGDENGLDAIRCAGVDDCWAAGAFGEDGVVSLELNQILHWNGHNWSQASVPNPAGITDGDFNTISSLSCTSASNCWAVGNYGTQGTSSSSYQNEALHWNGHKWTKVATPNPDGTSSAADNYLTSVNCTTPDNCWAVGSFGGSDSASLGEALHWKGTKWVLIKTPDPGGTGSDDQNSLSSVRCLSRKDCWSVGYSRTDPNPDHNVTLRWNSVKWSAS